MRDSLHVIGHRTLKEIVIPGTHDSAAYKQSDTLMPGTQTNFVEFLIKNSGGLLHETIKKLETTQEIDVYEQLLAGARYIDIRAGWIDGEWMTYHCHVGEKLELVLRDIERFLDFHECEVVIVEISHFKSKNSQPNKEELYRIIMEHLGDKLYPVNYRLDFTVSEVVRSGRRAIVALPKNYDDEGRGIWRNSFIKNTYPDANKLELVKSYNKKLCRDRVMMVENSNHKLLKMSWILTPDIKQLTRALLQIAIEVNKEMSKVFFQESKKREVVYGNILIIDNFAKSEIMYLIYKMNKILP